MLMNLEAFAEDLINEKTDFAYENAVKCILSLKVLMSKEEWTEYLKELYRRHYRKINLWSKIELKVSKSKRKETTYSSHKDRASLTAHFWLRRAR